ncbi:DUF3185 domain-containing protein [Cytobacillus kochii]|uniref:DoxX family protein n=1 Tax=Cytobacillus kochii TaxID=859143 RepID=A0A248TN71_9BACI|nr:DUF3185 domain-containing protein [Cytobacillus kochii]ASV69656.1 hypothetical protein CKF48_21505 [Cytobacillus kochii]
MKNNNILYTMIRLFLGIAMIGSGAMMLVISGFPTEYENATATLYMNAMEETVYFVPFLAIVKIICGLAFVSKRFMPLALIVFISISINMVAFHLFLEPLTGVPAYFIFAMNVYLMVKHLPDYRNLLQAKRLN